MLSKNKIFWQRLLRQPATTTTVFRSSRLNLVHTSSPSSSSSIDRRRPRDLANEDLFRSPTNDADAAEDVHLNPVTHWKELQKKAAAPEEEGGGQKSVRISILGVPNAGKSSLVNALCGFAACPYSQRTHTTRANAKAVLTIQDTQVLLLSPCTMTM